MTREWHITHYARLKKAKLQQLVNDAVADGYLDHGTSGTVPQLKAALQLARARYWEDKAGQRSVASPIKSHVSLCQITATEVNAWLRSLPRPRDCALTAEQVIR